MPRVASPPYSKDLVNKRIAETESQSFKGLVLVKNLCRMKADHNQTVKIVNLLKESPFTKGLVVILLMCPVLRKGRGLMKGD